MGAWGAGAFDNDSVLDFLAEYEESGKRAIVATFEEVEANLKEGYIEVDAGSAAIGAAEIVAAANGVGTDGFSDHVSQTISLHASELEGNKDLLVSAAKCVEMVLSGEETSELYELWTEGENADDWLAPTADLVRRLKGRAE